MLAVKASLIFAVALLLVTVLRRQSAALRHLVLTAAMIGVLVLPLLSLARLPAIRISAPAAEALVLETTVTSTAAANVAGRQSSISYNWPKMLGALWLGGSCIGFVRILLALMVLARLRRNATQLDGIVLESAETMMPIAFGVFRPAVALPIPARNWPGERRRAVLDHELAHVERRDPATHLLARLALAAHWWNPFAWLAWKQFLKEQERAADDLVLAGGTAPVDYASHLLEIARGFNTTALAVPMARRSQLESRLSAILDNSVNRRAMTRGGAVVVAVVMAAVLFPIAAAQVAGTTSEPGVVQGRGKRTAKSEIRSGLCGL
jgi:beta-lactamase regulating signal transducer with metallopeptidase domain